MCVCVCIDYVTTINHYNATASATATLITVTPPRTGDTRGLFRKKQRVPGPTLPWAMNDREKWRERVRDIRATSTT